MTLPVSFQRVLAAFQRLSPSWPDVSSTDTKAGKELASVARVFARVVDTLEVLFVEMFPDTATQIIDRWEAVTGVPHRPADSLATRQGRVLGILRQLGGPRIAQLTALLITPFNLTADQIGWIEPTLATIGADPDAIFNLFALRDYTLPGVYDLAEAQRLLNRYALGHINAVAIERTSFLTEDPHSLTDREPLGD